MRAAAAECLVLDLEKLVSTRCRASIRQRSRSQLSNLIPESSVPIAGELGPRAYSVSQADKSTVCENV